MFKLLVLLPFIVSLAGTAVSAPIAADDLVARMFRHKGQGAAAAAPAAGAQTAGALSAGAQTSAVVSPAAATVSPVAVSPAAAGTGTAPSATAAPPTAAGAEPAGSTECEDVTSPFECTNIQAVVDAFGTAPCSALLASQRFPATLKGTTQCTPFDTLPLSFNGPDPDADLPKAMRGRRVTCAMHQPPHRDEWVRYTSVIVKQRNASKEHFSPAFYEKVIPHAPWFASSLLFPAA
ncbi:hypothetical protein B0H19DRAFT_1073672 [Mycena capillaripes]|nr:hypothetical protein B0H19DRAFT_1073672 [Mycena capillaripes]